jgi:hypothetical protein
LIFYGEQPLADTLKAVTTLPPHTAIFFQQLSVDGAGAVYGDKEPLKRIYEVANAPIFSFDQSYFVGQTVGGPMFSPTEGAQPMAAVAIRMLGGEKTSGIDPVGFSTPKYDWRLLQRWNISESRLPPASEILFREPSAWEQYKWQIALILAVILAQAGLISALLSAHRQRRLAEVQSRQRMKELAHVNRFSTAGELTATIAQEINQPLGSVLTNAETAQAILKSPNPDIVELNEIVGDIVRDNRRASDVIRKIRDVMKRHPSTRKTWTSTKSSAKPSNFFRRWGSGGKSNWPISSRRTHSLSSGIAFNSSRSLPTWSLMRWTRRQTRSAKIASSESELCVSRTLPSYPSLIVDRVFPKTN